MKILGFILLAVATVGCANNVSTIEDHCAKAWVVETQGRFACVYDFAGEQLEAPECEPTCPMGDFYCADALEACAPAQVSAE